MPETNIIVIGASAGGVEALQGLLTRLPARFPASVFIVLHLPARSPTCLPEILTRAGGMVAIHPPEGARIEPGRVYVAPPDRHLVIESNHVHLSSGPKEQHRRPCINVTFRSAAHTHGDRVVGVILTGEMDDGVASLYEIKRRGGIAVVQNPEEALFPSMPLSALREVKVDYTVSLTEMAPLLQRLAAGEGQQRRTRIEKEAMESKLT